MIVLKIVWVLSSEGLGGTVISLTTSVLVPSMGLLSILMRVCRTVARANSSMFPSTYVVRHIVDSDRIERSRAHMALRHVSTSIRTIPVLVLDLL